MVAQSKALRPLILIRSAERAETVALSAERNVGRSFSLRHDARRQPCASFHAKGLQGNIQGVFCRRCFVKSCVISTLFRNGLPRQSLPSALFLSFPLLPLSDFRSSPCAEASKASMDCLNRHDYDRDKCLDFFQAYRDCKKAWVRPIIPSSSPYRPRHAR